MYDTAGDYEKRDEFIKTLVSIGPDFKFSNMLDHARSILKMRQFEEMHRYIDEVDLKDWTTVEGMHKSHRLVSAIASRIRMKK